jgi:LysM repeat protein
MKIMKVLGVVVGVHVFALILIFANPGCSSTSNPIMFNPDAPALAGGGGIRFTPTRPGTAAASTLVAEPVANVTPASTYTVTSGDSLWSIAHKKNLTVAELAAANNLGSSAVLHAGQKLLIPGKFPAHAAAPAAAAAPVAAKSVPAPKAPADSVKHTVKTGETLSSIAKNYGVRQGDIAVANNIQDPQKIRAGMELVIPGWRATSEKNAKISAGTSASKAAPAGGSTASPASSAAGQIPVIGPGTTPTAIPVIPVDEAPPQQTKP